VPSYAGSELAGLLGASGRGQGDTEGKSERDFVELNNAVSDDVAAWIDLAQLHDRYVR